MKTHFLGEALGGAVTRQLHIFHLYRVQEMEIDALGSRMSLRGCSFANQSARAPQETRQLVQRPGEQGPHAAGQALT